MIYEVMDVKFGGNKFLGKLFCFMGRDLDMQGKSEEYLGMLS